MRWRKDAVLDPLTGLLNRQGLQQRFREVAEQARLTDQPVSIVAFDLDEFKRVNDSHGHAQGDAVLQDVAYALRKTLRSFELLYRIGGEELLLILPGTELAIGCKIAERVRGAIEQSEPAGTSRPCWRPTDYAAARRHRTTRLPRLPLSLWFPERFETGARRGLCAPVLYAAT